MDIKLGKITRIYWRFSWSVSTPLILSVLIVASLVNAGHVNYNGHVYPMSIQIIGYMITGCTLMAVPLSALSELARCYSSDEPLTTLLRPTHQWGPHHYQEDV